MARQTSLSTAASAENLEIYFSKILQHAVDGQDGSCSYALDRLAQIKKVANLGLKRLRQPVAGDASDLVKALEGEQKAIDTILEKGRWLMSEPYLSGARVTIGTDNMKDAGDIQKAFAELKKSAITRHRQGEK